MKKLTLITCLLCFLTACEVSSSKNSEQATEQATEQITEQITEQTTDSDNRQCFLSKTVYDEYEAYGKTIELAVIIQLSLTVTDNDVVGTYDFFPGEKDAMQGEFKGMIDENNMITSTYTYVQEGEVFSEELIIELKDNMAIIGDEILPKTSCDDLKKENHYDGTYKYEDETSSGSVVIKSINDYELSFEISTGNMKGCTGETSGTATIKVEGVASFSDDDCTELLFDFTDNTLNITEKDCSDYHGMTCTFSGSYIK